MAGNIQPHWETCILAGGLSSRMKQDKTRLRLGRRTLLGHARAKARQLGPPVRVIRRDQVPRCGPLGGVCTALRTTRARNVLFLPCDLPFVSLELLRRVQRRLRRPAQGVFAWSQGLASFPFALRRNASATVEKQLAKKKFSLQQLARALRGRIVRLGPTQPGELFNVNTAKDWRIARRRWPSANPRPQPRRHGPRPNSRRRKRCLSVT